MSEFDVVMWFYVNHPGVILAFGIIFLCLVAKVLLPSRRIEELEPRRKPRHPPEYFDDRERPPPPKPMKPAPPPPIKVSY